MTCSRILDVGVHRTLGAAFEAAHANVALSRRSIDLRARVYPKNLPIVSTYTFS